MNNKTKILLCCLTAVASLGMSACRDFDEVNTNPTAASQEQVLPEYLINRAIIAAQSSTGRRLGISIVAADSL